MLRVPWARARLPKDEMGSRPDMSAVRTTSRLAMALLVGTLLLVVAAPTAGAQTDPYGSTTTTAPSTERDVIATCGLTVKEGRPGDTVEATVGGVFFGEKVRILFDGVQVATVTAPLRAEAVGGAVAFNGAALPAQAVSTTVKVSFTVPNAAPGNHLIVAVGDTFTCFCNPDGVFKVLGAKAGKIPKTGIYVGLFLAMAAVFLLAGRAFLAESRRRRAEALAEAQAEDRERTYADI